MLLTLETSTAVCSAALFENGKLLAHSELFIQKAHATMLTVLIDQLLQQVGLPSAALSGVAVSAGPGSYTGLRVGVSVAKGLCFALQIPLYMADTLRILARVAQSYVWGQPSALLMPMLDARRMEVYTAVFRSDLSVVTAAAPLVLTEGVLAGLLSEQPIMVFGDGAEKAYKMLAHPNLHFLPNLYPSAKALGELLTVHPLAPADLAYSEPVYLKEFQTQASFKQG